LVSQDPLILIPSLLRSENKGVTEMATLIARTVSPKEVILALKEVGELLYSLKDVNSEEEPVDDNQLPLPKHCALMIRLYTAGEK
jgi:hypothetical protein